MRYQVICVNKGPAGTHEHITHLGLGNSTGWTRRITVAEAITQLRSPFGDRYYTISPSTGREADVIEGGCEVCGQRPYVRTTADGIRDNNLSNLVFCKVACGETLEIPSPKEDSAALQERSPQGAPPAVRSLCVSPRCRPLLAPVG